MVVAAGVCRTVWSIPSIPPRSIPVWWDNAGDHLSVTAVTGCWAAALLISPVFPVAQRASEAHRYLGLSVHKEP